MFYKWLLLKHHVISVFSGRLDQQLWMYLSKAKTLLTNAKFEDFM